MRILSALLALSALVYAGEGDLKWKLKTGGGIHSSPAIAQDGTIYIGSDSVYLHHHLYAIKPDGTMKWRCQTTANFYYSAPAIGTDGTIYVGADYDSLYTFSPDGSLKWSYATWEFENSTPAIGYDGTLYFWKHDSVCAITSDGVLKWSSNANQGLGGVVSYPVIGSDSTIYVVITGADYFPVWMYAFNPDGTRKWGYEVQGWGDLVVARSSAIGADGTIYICASPSLQAINPNGSTKWVNDSIRTRYSSPAIAPDGIIYVVSGGTGTPLYAINQDGSIKWRVDIWKAKYDCSSPAVASDGTIYVGSLDSNFYAINPNGTIKWSYKTEGEIWSSPAIASDGTVYFGSTDGYLYAVEGSAPLADSPWPKFRHDNQNTGRVGGSGAIVEQPSEPPGLSLSASAVSDCIRVSYTLPEGQSGVLRIYNVSGQRVAETSVTSSGEKELGQGFPRGVYIVRLESETRFTSAKVILR